MNMLQIYLLLSHTNNHQRRSDILVVQLVHRPILVGGIRQDPPNYERQSLGGELLLGQLDRRQSFEVFEGVFEVEGRVGGDLHGAHANHLRVFVLGDAVVGAAQFPRHWYQGFLLLQLLQNSLFLHHAEPLICSLGIQIHLISLHQDVAVLLGEVVFVADDGVIVRALAAPFPNRFLITVGHHCLFVILFRIVLFQFSCVYNRTSD